MTATRTPRRTTLPDPSAEPTISVDRASRVLGLSDRATYAACERGDIPVSESGGASASWRSPSASSADRRDPSGLEIAATEPPRLTRAHNKTAVPGSGAKTWS